MLSQGIVPTLRLNTRYQVDGLIDWGNTEYAREGIGLRFFVVIRLIMGSV
jgi:hypothetical protein